MKKTARRRLLSSALALGAGTALLGTRVGHEQARALPKDGIRPPGALPGREFLAACIRCGMCVQACPPGALRLADFLGDPVPAGTPFFRARTKACTMCESIPCVTACPTGALRHSLHDIADARMGLAELSAPDRCLSYTGAAYCNSCYWACPIAGTAIRMKQVRTRGGGFFMPVVDPDHCTGCGLCEQACVLEGEAAITVRANHAAAR